MGKMILINGMANGGIYAILAVGFSLVFGVAKILNMAHTAFYMLAGFLIFMATSMLSFPLLLSVVLAILITIISGVLCFEVFLDRVKEHEIAVMIISVALAILFQEVFLSIFTGLYRGVPPFITGFVQIFDIRVSYQHILNIGTSICILIGLWLLLSKTKLGKALRAVAEDREIANLMGINVSRMCAIAMGISAGLAAVAGALIAPILMVSPLMWVHPLITVLAAVILGGLGSIKGSVIAAFILGFTETTVVFLIPGGSFIKGAVSMIVMIIVLLVKPEGLFGVVFEEERL
jgi:branched-chain amino acid transport system permease protein